MTCQIRSPSSAPAPIAANIGNKAVRAYLQVGYRVFPVHPTATEIEGQTAYRSVFDFRSGSLIVLASICRRRF